MDVGRDSADHSVTTKQGNLGTGMGLAIVYSIMRRHGGTVEIESRENVGTRVTLGFPVPKPASSEGTSGENTDRIDNAMREHSKETMEKKDDDPCKCGSVLSLLGVTPDVPIAEDEYTPSV